MEHSLQIGNVGVRLVIFTPSTPVARRSIPAWCQALSTALLLYLVGLVALAFTQNLILFPAVVILGSCAVPVAYVAFLYERKHLSTLTVATTAVAFFFGGMLSVYVASLLENLVFSGPEVLTALEASLIEEPVKILCVLLVAQRIRHDSEVDGMILGAAVGMGFAALESAGYAFTTFFYSQGSLATTIWLTRQTGGIILTPTLVVTLLRGLLSPMAHGTWTAILAGVLFRESLGGYFRLNAKVTWACLLVLTLHGLWDAMPGIVATFAPANVCLLVTEAVVGAMGLFILRRQWCVAVRSNLQCAQMESESGAVLAEQAG